MNAFADSSLLNLDKDPVISLSKVSKTYKLYPSHKDRLKEALHPFRKHFHSEFSALIDVSLSIRKGESVGILGRNGAGKSTLLQLIAGVIIPTTGNICVSGQVAALLELGAGFNPDLTGRENVLLSNTIQGIEKKKLSELLSKIEEFADIGSFFDQPMKLYSSGMFARVAFSNAIHVNPDILIIDEILGVGDAKFQEKCYHKINSLKEQGVCILFVSHSTDVVQRNCDRALLIDSGRLINDDVTDKVVSYYHDLLYGAKKIGKIDRSGEVSIPNESCLGDKINISMLKCEQESFLKNNNILTYKSFSYYNPNERRIGDGSAEIFDFIVSANLDLNFNILAGDEIVHIYIKVKYNRDVENPQLGWAIVSQEGIVISGSNTVMQKITLNRASRDDVKVYCFEIKISLCGGQYFFNLGLGEYENHEWIYFDVRQSVCHISVADSGLASGFFQIPSTFTEIL